MFLFHLFFPLFFYVYSLPHFIPLLLGCLKPSRDHNANITLSHPSLLTKAAKRIVIPSFFHFFLFPFAPRLFPYCLLWFQNVFSLHEILLILFSLVFSFVRLTFKKNGWRNLPFFLSNLHVFHIPFLFLLFSFTRKNLEERKYIDAQVKSPWVHPMYCNLHFQYLVSSAAVTIAEPSHLTVT